MLPPISISTILTLRKLPLLLHIIIESAAAYTFIFKPSSQLPRGLFTPSNSYQSSAGSPTCSTSSCPCPEETSRQPSKRYLSPSSSSSSSSSTSSPTPPPLKHKDKHTLREKTTPAGIPAVIQEELNLILLSYGGLLLTSNLICLIFLLRPISDHLSGLVSLAMATYHVWPVHRAWSRITMSHNGANHRKVSPDPKEKKVLGGPVVHLAAHLVLLAGLVLSGLSGLVCLA